MLQLLAMLSALSGTAVERPVRFFAVGSSETAGYGVPDGASYPALLARRCGRHVSVLAKVAFPVLLQPPPKLRRSDAVVLFITYNDLFQLEAEPFESRLLVWLTAVGGEPNRLVVLPPPVRSQRIWEIYGVSEDAALRRERTRWSRVESLARERRIAVLRFVTADATYLQPDRLHPNRKGQRELAEQIARRLPLCSN